jgi:hypothetical protein
MVDRVLSQGSTTKMYRLSAIHSFTCNPQAWVPGAVSRPTEKGVLVPLRW